MPRHGKAIASVLAALLLTGALLPRAMANSSLPSEAGSLASSESKLLPQPLHPAGQAPGVREGIGGGARLLSATSAGMTFELDVPWEQVRLTPVTVGDRQYVRVSIPGWPATARVGAPGLPFLAEVIGAPFGVNVTVRAVPGPAHTLALPAPVLPVASTKVEWDPATALDGVPNLPAPNYAVEEDSAVYAAQAAYPQALAEVVTDGALRQQRVIGIAAYPVQYHPESAELTIYESLRVEVAFEGPPLPFRRAPSTDLAAPDSAVYENLFRRELLNYEIARQWRQPGTPPSAQLAAGTAGGAVPWAPPVPGWRVKVRTDDFYRLTYDELLAAGLVTDTLDPRTFQVYHLGTQIAIEVPGEADGRFDPDDSIVFYGRAIASKYTRDNVYWLTHGGDPGLRMAARHATPGEAETPAFYSARLHVEQNEFYVPKTPGDENHERWFWDYVYPPHWPSWSHTVSLAAPYSGPYTATLTVAMLGFLQYPINPDHHTQVYLNGTLIEDAWWDGVTWHVSEIDVAQDVLVAGNNTISVTCPNDTGLGYDVVEIDWVELVYANTFLATDDELAFNQEVTGTWRYQADGFSTDQLIVYDVTDPSAVVRLEGTDVAPSGSGYELEFQDTITAPARYWATSSTDYRTVQGIEQDTPSDLRSTENGADYILVTHQAFTDTVAALREYRESQGLRAVQVDVQDVYDEFGFGIEGAAPIREFLAYAYQNWQEPAPSYVVLVGDGNYDPKNYLGHGRVSYVPPYLAPVDPWIGETAADNRYVTVAGADNLPDMMLGRLSVNSTFEATAVVDKILAYEQIPAPGPWQQQVLAVADNADGAGNFAQMSDDLLTASLPEPYQATKVYYGITHSTPEAASAAIQAGINAGKLIVNYIGHAAPTFWAGERLFTSEDVPLLDNGDKLPVMLPMTCYEGYYHDPYPIADKREAMGEVVTRAEGRGAVASWSPTGLGVASGHDYLNHGFYEAVFQDGAGLVGEATAAGKLKLWATGASLDLLDTYLLFGDPALHLALVPAAVELTSFTAVGGTDAITLTWETASEIDNSGFNLYRSEAADGEKTKINAELIPSQVAPDSALGSVYEYRDTTVAQGTIYFYWLENVDIYDRTGLFGPVEAQIVWDWQIYLPAILGDGQGPSWDPQLESGQQ